MISYEPLRTYMFKNDISWYNLKKTAGLSSATIKNLQTDKIVKVQTIDFICEKYNVLIEDVMVHIPNDQYVYVPDPVGPKNAKNTHPRKEKDNKSKKSKQ